jgi:outer membrane lipoprotein-sorting protein
MFRFIIILLILNFYYPAFSSTKEKIISQMRLTNILSFEFIQTIGKKNENGFCIIKYPKKIFCKYSGSNKKTIVSNGQSLVIKNENSGSYYVYPLNRTPLELLLDKEYLISKIITLEPKDINSKFLIFKIFKNNNEINIFFDKKNFNLIGWQTVDIYQNLNTTFISSIKINQKINDKIFILPKNN